MRTLPPDNRGRAKWPHDVLQNMVVTVSPIATREKAPARFNAICTHGFE